MAPLLMRRLCGGSGTHGKRIAASSAENREGIPATAEEAALIAEPPALVVRGGGTPVDSRLREVRPPQTLRDSGELEWRETGLSVPFFCGSSKMLDPVGFARIEKEFAGLSDDEMRRAALELERERERDPAWICGVIAAVARHGGVDGWTEELILEMTRRTAKRVPTGLDLQAVRPSWAGPRILPRLRSVCRGVHGGGSSPEGFGNGHDSSQMRSRNPSFHSAGAVGVWSLGLDG
ncbi:MAG TPA: hypothetical protein VGD74_08540 [Vulgatibacter sp.]